MQATDASTSQTALNISAAFSDFAQLQVVPDGRNLHLLAPADNGSLVSKDTPIASARKLLDTLRQASSSLTAAMNYPVSDQRAVTLYKESSQHEHAIHKATFTAQVTLQALRVAHEKANPTNQFQPSTFGLSVPLLRSNLATFVLSRIEEWATVAGLEYFLDDPHSTSLDASAMPPPSSGIEAQKLPDDGKEGKKIMVSLTKEELLVDLEFEKNLFAEDKRIDLPVNHHVVPLLLHHIKIHNGERDDSSATPDGQLGGTLHQLLEEKIRALLKALGCGDGKAWAQLDTRAAETAAEELKIVLGELRWIAETVKHEEEKDAGRGVQWWECTSTIAANAMTALRSDVALLKIDAESAAVPLDTLLLHSSGLPFPYLNSLSTSFLLYLPPLAYLTLLRSTDPNEKATAPANAITDIPIMHIRKLVSDATIRDRLHIPLCTLSFEPDSPTPTDAATADVAMEQASSYNFLTMLSEPTKGRWVLSFSTGSSGAPLILSQSRMKRLATAVQIQSVANPHALDLMALGATPAAVGPSWLDLTIDPHSTQPSRVYTSRYQPKETSPSTSKSGDPEILNTLLPLVEPGLALGKVPVRNLGEALEVMKIVKEQLWLNGLLRDALFQSGYGAADISLQGHSGGITSSSDINPGMDEAKAMYDALMSGSYISPRLRVTYEIIGDGRTGLRASFSLSGKMVNVEVTLDRSCEKGLRVTVDGGRVENLEEVFRRGGILALIIAIRNMRLKSV